MILLILIVLLVGFVPPAFAHPLAHPDAPRLLNLRPAPGEVVPLDTGQVEIAALAAGNAEIVSWSVAVDGRSLDATSTGGDHATISARATQLSPGDHVAKITITDETGRTTKRSWPFAVGGVRVTRLAGPDRIETAVEISRDLYPDGGAGSAVLARVDSFPDALAGVPLATQVDGPLLLTASDELSPETAAELSRILDEGATVHLLGGSSALGSRVEAAVAELGLAPQRVAGGSRYATAVAVAAALPQRATAVVVSGESFPDALAASSPAGLQGWPILLTPPDQLAEETRAYLDANGFQQAIVVGGIGDQVVDELEGVVDQVERLSGLSSFDTAAKVARRFFPDAEAVALANVEPLADALAGGRHAAERGLPVLLTTSDALPSFSAAVVGDLAVTSAVVYGGTDVVSEQVVADLDRASIDAGGPGITELVPGAGAVVPTLDQVVVRLDREVVLDESALYLTMDGQEVGGVLERGDFASTLLFTVSELPVDAVRGVEYEFHLTGVVSDGSATRHLDSTFVLSKPYIGRGDSGPEVDDLQERLVAAGYWLGSESGEFGPLTHQAVVAFQKVHGLPRDGVYDPNTQQVLESNPPRPAPRSSAGLVIEVDKPRQVLLMVRDGRVEWIFNTSTGTEQPYEYEGRTYLADTPPGHWQITREVDGVRYGPLGALYRPKYFHPDGIAIHGSSSVPPYPDSHGCVRVSDPAMDWMWEENRVPIGTGVWVY